MILKIKNLTVIIFSLLMMSGCAKAQESVDAKNILIVYLSKILEEFSVEGGKERDGVLFVMKGEKEKKVTIQVKEWLGK
ncbi:hypothetical protein [Chryseobacterium sp. Leaf394]|uniref:hypothetical protein n=1 Tax=Chryseobacterium sp. Leaf394 TaxID=1736361 RepID=UPI0006FAEAFB|nr:hypothetical protein [Chryseobacterium sp. Leaf394]KQS91938.1 hypothetical protein ASG21_05630 [Chryseobacterium sp. Leaf394]